jgi:hypothetical protein
MYFTIFQFKNLWLWTYVLISESGQFSTRVAQKVVSAEQSDFVAEGHVIEDSWLRVHLRINVHQPLVDQMACSDHFSNFCQRPLAVSTVYKN